MKNEIFSRKNVRLCSKRRCNFKQQCRPTFTGQLQSTNEDCVPTAAIYPQTINDNVLWTVITRMSCVTNPLSRLRYRLFLIPTWDYSELWNIAYSILWLIIALVYSHGKAKLTGYSLFTSEAPTIQHDCCSPSVCVLHNWRRKYAYLMTWPESD